MREGGDDEAPLIGRYCGDTLPSEHVSSGNEIYVRFKTDHSVSGTGFRIRYDLSKVIQICKIKLKVSNYGARLNIE